MSVSSDIDARECSVDCINPEEVRRVRARVVSPEAAGDVAAMFFTLADGTRVRLVQALAEADELCVCDLAAITGLSQSATSHQLRLLREADVVTRRKDGRIAYYRLADEHVRRMLADGLAHAGETARRLAG